MLFAAAAFPGLLFPSPATAAPAGEPFDILVFSKTTGFRHGSIADGRALIADLAAANGFTADFSEDSADFTDANLAAYAAVVFLSTTGEILDSNQQAAFERYIEGGGGWVGVHSAADTEYNWPWYNRLLGAHFANHPAQQTATIRVEDDTHPSTAHLPATWVRRDEWYNYRTNPRAAGVTVLLTLDESTYNGGTMGDDHPIAWYQPMGEGRAWYTGLGHTSASFSEPHFIDHLLGGILYAAGATDGGSSAATRRTTELVPAGSTWAYWDRGTDLGTAWREPDFDDGAWPFGRAKLGFGDGDHETAVEIGPDGARYPTLYFRHRFNLPRVPLTTRLTVRIQRDDGAVVYLNGTEVGRSNMDPGEVTYSTPAADSVGGNDEDAFFPLDATASVGALRAGENVLAVEIHQSGSGSSDLGFDLSLTLQEVLPPPVAIARAPGGGLQISWPEAYSATYGAVLERADSLQEPNWEVVLDQPEPAEGTATLTLPPPAPGASAFFRLRYGTPAP